jgi:hypothetical protein
MVWGSAEYLLANLHESFKHLSYLPENGNGVGRTSLLRALSARFPASDVVRRRLMDWKTTTGTDALSRSLA